MQKCDYCLGFAEMESDPEYCECHTLSQVKRSFVVKFVAIGATSDWGMGAGVIGVQEFSLYADSEEEAQSDLFNLAAQWQAEELIVNFVSIQIEERDHAPNQ